MSQAARKGEAQTRPMGHALSESQKETPARSKWSAPSASRVMSPARLATATNFAHMHTPVPHVSTLWESRPGCFSLSAAEAGALQSAALHVKSPCCVAPSLNPYLRLLTAADRGTETGRMGEHHLAVRPRRPPHPRPGCLCWQRLRCVVHIETKPPRGCTWMCCDSTKSCMQHAAPQ